MKIFLFLMILLFSVQVNAQMEFFDKEGKRVYVIEDSGKTHDVTMSDGRTGTYHEKVLIDASGKAYTFDHKWEQIISDGKVIMNYNFNRRRWEWVEAADLTASKFGKKEDIQRIYERVKYSYISPDKGDKITDNSYTTPDQGDHPILRVREGNYIDEFGQVVYSRERGGSTPVWTSIILLHNYYQKNYLDPDFISNLADRRKIIADNFGDTNSIALDMLELGKDYETNQTTFMGENFEMIYYTEIEGSIKILDKEQIKQLKNGWLILNPNTYRSSNPHQMPEGGFYVSKKQAKKIGIQGISSKSIVLEIKIKPEAIADFQSIIVP